MWSNHSQGKDDRLFGATLVADLWRDIQAINSGPSLPASLQPSSQVFSLPK